jgi:Putative lumazine-binding
VEAATSPTLTKDRADVVATALDYFEGWFDGDVERLDRALHPGLAKRSLSQVDPDSPELRTVTKERMLGLTAEGEGKREDPGDRRIDVEVVDVCGNIATVVIRSAVYREYLHLVCTDDGWKIVNALWHFE